MGWISHAYTKREAQAIARRNRWERLPDPSDSTKTIDVCPPCAFRVRQAVEVNAPQPEREQS
jgi:hypothetical protein